MKQLLIIFGFFVFFTSFLFGVRENSSTAAVFDQPQKLSAISCPSPAIILPSVFQPFGEQSPSDQFKKVKSFLGSSFLFFCSGQNYHFEKNNRSNNLLLFDQLFILYHNLRL
ncbi:MAG TPA: hypothetical protein VK014_05125 [Cyclobacteriaceae bacterium]|nr:hypothetical protein [Cyclobacteriaceae bacterium]